MTREDLAYRVFFVTPRTITRDLRVLRQTQADQQIPLRGTVHDIGPVLSHRTEIVRLALEGHVTTQICQRLRHSPDFRSRSSCCKPDVASRSFENVDIAERTR